MFYRILSIIVLHIHNWAYKTVTRLAVRAGDGLHPKHRLMNYHAFFVDRVLETDRVLDIGCGNGALAFDVAKKAKEVVAIDLEPKNIEKATRSFSRKNISYRVADATKDLGGEVFDVILLSNVLEHIEHRVEFLQKIRSLAPKILLRVPMIDRDWLTLYKKELGVEWRLDPTHFTEYTLEMFMSELAVAGFKIQSYSIQFGEIWCVVHPVLHHDV